MWEPLENLFKDDLDKCGEFMFMGTTKNFTMNRDCRKDIHLYKHINTRRYINIDSKGKFYDYDSVTNSYIKINKDCAINHVFN